jgi:hypothetical protein
MVCHKLRQRERVRIKRDLDGVYGFKRYNVYSEREVAVRGSGIMIKFMAINVIRERERLKGQ